MHPNATCPSRNAADTGRRAACVELSSPPSEDTSAHSPAEGLCGMGVFRCELEGLEQELSLCSADDESVCLNLCLRCSRCALSVRILNPMSYSNWKAFAPVFAFDVDSQRENVGSSSDRTAFWRSRCIACSKRVCDGCFASADTGRSCCVAGTPESDCNDDRFSRGDVTGARSFDSLDLDLLMNLEPLCLEAGT